LQTAVSVIDKRLETVYDGQVTVKIKNNLIELDLHEKVNVNELLSLVLSSGQFSMQEVYTSQEIFQQLMALDPDLSNIGFLSVQAGVYNAIVGEAGRYDTAEVVHSSTMQALKKQYDDSAQFLWGRETKEWTLPLYALKKTIATPVLDNRSVMKSNLDHDERGEESVFVELKEDYHDAWLTMTRKNIGKSIAIRLDDQVLSAPTVSSEIPNGRLVISGGLNGKARILAALISADVLPVSLRVATVDPELQDSPERSYPTKHQIEKYNALRKEYIQYRHRIDSLLRRLPVHINITSMRHELGRVYYEDLPSIVNEAGLTQKGVDEFLEKASITLQGFKMRIDPNAIGTPESLFDSLASLAPKNGSQ
jgi:hypothetical protein